MYFLHTHTHTLLFFSTMIIQFIFYSTDTFIFKFSLPSSYSLRRDDGLYRTRTVCRGDKPYSIQFHSFSVSPCRTNAFIRRHRRRVIQFNRARSRHVSLSVCECKTSHSRAKVLAACANRRSPLPARAAKTRVVACEHVRERDGAQRGRETREERSKEADDNDDDDGGGGGGGSGGAGI